MFVDNPPALSPTFLKTLGRADTRLPTYSVLAKRKSFYPIVILKSSSHMNALLLSSILPPPFSPSRNPDHNILRNTPPQVLLSHHLRHLNSPNLILQILLIPPNTPNNQHRRSHPHCLPPPPRTLPLPHPQNPLHLLRQRLPRCIP